MENSQFTSIDEIIGQKHKTLQTSLEVMAIEIFERLNLRALNQQKLFEEKEKLYALLQVIAVGIPYGRRSEDDRRMVYQQMWAVDREKREHDVECWRDVLGVMERFLVVWQEHQQAKARMQMLEGFDV